MFCDYLLKLSFLYWFVLHFLMAAYQVQTGHVYTVDIWMADVNKTLPALLPALFTK